MACVFICMTTYREIDDIREQWANNRRTNKKSRTYGTSDLSDLSDLSESLRESDLSESPICERPKWEADL